MGSTESGDGCLKKEGGGGLEPPYELWLEVRSVFLDISKAFDKVWHKRPIFKLKKNGISDELFTSYLIF